MEYIVDRCLPGDEVDIVELLQLVFNGWPRFDLSCTPLEHWKWKFFENPFSRKILVKTVNEKDKKIIGCHLSVDLKVKLIDDYHYFNNGLDLVVHPDFRRMGIWNNMFTFRSQLLKDAGINYGFSSTGNPIIKSAIVPTRMIFPRSISQFVRIKNLDFHFKMAPSDNVFFKKIGYKVLNAINKIIRKSKVASDANIIINEISKFDSSVDVFWEQVSNDYSFIVERRQEYLNWRYCDLRGGDYHVLTAEDNGSLLGYCVLRVNKYFKDYPRGYIVDLLTLPDRFDVSSALIQRAFTYFDNYDVNVIDSIAVKKSPMETSLRKCGFLDSRSKLFVTLGLRDMSEEEKANIARKLLLKKVHFVYGDLDVI